MLLPYLGLYILGRQPKSRYIVASVYDSTIFGSLEMRRSTKNSRYWDNSQRVVKEDAQSIIGNELHEFQRMTTTCLLVRMLPQWSSEQDFYVVTPFTRTGIPFETVIKDRNLDVSSSGHQVFVASKFVNSLPYFAEPTYYVPLL